MTSDFKPKRAEKSQRPQLSTEEWMAKKQAEKEEAFAMIDETAQEVLSDPAKLQGVP